jgi:hypothetical protein
MLYTSVAVELSSMMKGLALVQLGSDYQLLKARREGGPQLGGAPAKRLVVKVP